MNRLHIWSSGFLRAARVIGGPCRSGYWNFKSVTDTGNPSGTPVIDSTSGALASINGSPFGAGSSPNSFAIVTIL
jgi:hypothetical protein